MFQLFFIFLLLIIVTAIIKKWEEKQYQKLNTKENKNISEYEFYKLKEEVEMLKEKILKLEFMLEGKSKSK